MKYRTKGVSVYLGRKFICAMPVNADMEKVNETRMNGESWLAMRERTEIERIARKVRGEEMAGVIVDALNAWSSAESGKK